MKKILAIVLFSFFMTGGIYVEARSGCCSWHGGVRSDGCGCNDGSALSATCAPYYSCSSGYSGNSYSNYTPSYVPTTPTCPSMATYDVLSDSCKCMSGYVVDSTGSCTSGNTVCHQKYGYNSSYSSYDKKCSCDSGYQFDSNDQCVSQQSYCASNFGYGAEYSNLKSKCVCKSGYVVDTATNKCVYDTSTYSSYTPSNTYTPPTTTTCPINSYSSNGNCFCSEGYQINSTKNACIAKNPTSLDQQCKNLFGTDSTWDAKNSSCSMKITVSSPVSTTNGNADESCKLSYGKGSFWNSKNCYCSSGYQWNTPVNKCIESKMKITKNLKEGASGVETVMLKNFLATQNLYFGIVSTPYDRETTSAVSSFQSQNGIPSTGTVGNLTRNKINSLMYKN